MNIHIRQELKGYPTNVCGNPEIDVIFFVHREDLKAG
jgi:hypothetical protein